MIKQSSLLKRSHSNKTSSKSANRHWIHPADALQHGHVVYLVKFLGNTEVEQAKGIEVVKEGIKKLKFNQQVKRSDGTKIPKVELTISVDGVAIQEPKAKRVVHHKYPLHRISYCADDKSDKKFFSFIAKEAETDKHKCFVFVSDKLAEEITLTIGQAFDLAYRRFLETSNRDLEMKKRFMILQKKANELMAENAQLRKTIAELQQLREKNEAENNNLLGDEIPTVGRRLENLLLADLEDLQPHNDAVTNGKDVDLFGAKPFNPVQATEDPFGMGHFCGTSLQEMDLENAIGAIDKKLLEMRDGFSCGLSFGNDDFSFDMLDTANKTN